MVPAETKDRQMTAMILASDILPTDNRAAGWWVSADKQGSLDMTGATLAEAVADLLAQCATDTERAGILAGSIEILADDA